MASPATNDTALQRFTVTKIDAGMAILLGAKASLIEFPSLLLPQDVTAGSVVEISVKRNLNEEIRAKQEFEELQAAILETFGQASPEAPRLQLRSVTQTSIVLEWSPLELASAKLLSLDIYRNGSRLAPIPSPLNNSSTKLSGLEVGVEYSFHLVMKTTAGTFTSNPIKTKTHSMTDTSGIAVCFGAVDGGPLTTLGETDEQVSQLEALSRDLLTEMGAKQSTKLQLETTHYICTSPRARATAGAASAPNGAQGGSEGPVYRKATHLNIPIVRPEWIVACHEQKKMVPISAYYIDKEAPNQDTVRKLLSSKFGSTSSNTAALAEEPREEDSAPPPPAPKDTKEDNDAAASTVAATTPVDPDTTSGTVIVSPESPLGEAKDSTSQVEESADASMEEINLSSRGESALDHGEAALSGGSQDVDGIEGEEVDLS